MSAILAFDCSTEYCSVALRCAQAPAARDVHALQGHAEQLIDHAAALLAEAGLSLAQCDAIAFGAGPGSFTGLRVACAVAQGLAFGADLPVIPIGTLAALAEAARLRRPDPLAPCRVLVAQDARMGEAYWSIEEWDGSTWHNRTAAGLTTPALIATFFEGPLTFGCGSAFVRFADVMQPLVSEFDAIDHPGAEAIAALAQPVLDAGQALPAHAARPVYVRDRVALTSHERAARSGAP